MQATWCGSAGCFTLGAAEHTVVGMIASTEANAEVLHARRQIASKAALAVPFVSGAIISLPAGKREHGTLSHRCLRAVLADDAVTRTTCPTHCPKCGKRTLR